MKFLSFVLLIAAVLFSGSLAYGLENQDPTPPAPLSVQPEGQSDAPVVAEKSDNPESQTLKEEIEEATEESEISSEASSMYNWVAASLTKSFEHDKFLWSLIGIIASAISLHKLKKGIASVHAKGVELTSHGEMIGSYVFAIGLVLLVNGIGYGFNWSLATANMCSIGFLVFIFGLAYAGESASKRRTAEEEAAKLKK